MGMLYTIGHSNHSPEGFLRLLAHHKIEVLVDVRSRPYSRHVPHFNRTSISAMLEGACVGYRYGGKHLGGLDGPSIESPDFLSKIDRIYKFASSGNVAMMCSEGRASECHRFYKLGAHILRDTGEIVHHVNRDGSVLLQDDAEEQAGEKELWHEFGPTCEMI